MIVTDGDDHVLTSSKTTKVNSASSRDVLQSCLPAPGGNNDLKFFLMYLDRTTFGRMEGEMIRGMSPNK